MEPQLLLRGTQLQSFLVPVSRVVPVVGRVVLQMVPHLRVAQVLVGLVVLVGMGHLVLAVAVAGVQPLEQTLLAVTVVLVVLVRLTALLGLPSPEQAAVVVKEVPLVAQVAQVAVVLVQLEVLLVLLVEQIVVAEQVVGMGHLVLAAQAAAV